MDYQILTELHERVRVASGPDPDLDKAILDALLPAAASDPPKSLWIGGKLKELVRSARVQNPPPITGSHDAFFKLLPQVLPISDGHFQPGDFTYEIHRTFPGQVDFRFNCSGAPLDETQNFFARHSSIPLAGCAAMLAVLMELTREPQTPEHMRSLPRFYVEELEEDPPYCHVLDRQSGEIVELCGCKGTAEDLADALNQDHR